MDESLSVDNGNENASEYDSKDRSNVIGQYDRYSETAARVQLSRFALTKRLLQQQKEKSNFASTRRRCRSAVSNCCRLETLGRAIVSFFPILSWFPAYRFKDDLLADILAGLTVGVMSIPQGMAYARLAGLPPIYGLYTNIIPTFVYFLLGTTKHAAIGPATVLSLIMSSIRYKQLPCEDCWMYTANSSNSSIDAGIFLEPASTLTPIEIGSAVAFLTGAFLILMGLFRLSFISDYLPDQLVGGFTVAAAVQVLAGQLPSMFGVKLPNRNGIGKVLMNFFDLFSVIARTNLATLLIFAICFAFLIFSKKIINPRFQRKFRLPFPAEFIVMVIATIASHFAQFGQTYGVSTVKHITPGFPIPSLPKFSIMSTLAADSFVLAIVTYTYSISLAKLYAKRNGYKIQTTQEFYAYGFMNLVGSFFQCFNSGQSVARSLVYEMAGARSQLCGMFGTLVVIVTVLFIAPFLESLPNAALAAIIVTAVVEMLLHLRELPSLFGKSRYDFYIYVVTLVSVIVLDVTYGLAVSVIFALITVIVKTQSSHVDFINQDVRYLCTSDELSEINDGINEESFWGKVVVLRPTSPIFYVNAEKAKNHLIEKGLMSAKDGLDSSLNENDLELNEKALLEKAENARPSIVILDMTSVGFTDLMGVNALKEALRRLKDEGVECYLCGCTDAVEELLRTTGFPGEANVPIFATVIDAISFANFRLSDKWIIVEKSL